MTKINKTTAPQTNLPRQTKPTQDTTKINKTTAAPRKHLEINKKPPEPPTKISKTTATPHKNLPSSQRFSSALSSKWAVNTKPEPKATRISQQLVSVTSCGSDGPKIDMKISFRSKKTTNLSEFKDGKSDQEGRRKMWKY
jgi:hypothetical protein